MSKHLVTLPLRIKSAVDGSQIVKKVTYFYCFACNGDRECDNHELNEYKIHLGM